jgi:hypothetical protein
MMRIPGWRPLVYGMKCLHCLKHWDHLRLLSFWTCPSSVILKNVSETGSVSVIRWRMGNTYSARSVRNSYVPLRDSLCQYNYSYKALGVSHPSPDDGRRSIFPYIVFFVFFPPEYQIGRQSKNKVILSVIHYHQKPWNLTGMVSLNPARAIVECLLIEFYYNWIVILCMMYVWSMICDAWALYEELFMY